MRNSAKQDLNMAESADQAVDQLHGVLDPERKTPANQKSGLCRTCDNAADCVFPKQGPVILNCDELDYPPQRTAEKEETAPPSPVRVLPERKPAVEPGEKELIGLCATCENRRECVFPKPAGGVWNCDEFV